MTDENSTEVDPDVMERMMRRVLDAEQEKLYLKNPRNINKDIKAIIEDEIK